MISRTIEKYQDKINSAKRTSFLPNMEHVQHTIISNYQSKIDKKIKFKNRNIFYDRNIEEKLCPVCGNSFMAPKNKIYCSKHCSKKAYRKRRKQRGKYPFSKKICIVCGQYFTPRTTMQVACSQECSEQYFFEHYGRIRGDFNPEDYPHLNKKRYGKRYEKQNSNIDIQTQIYSLEENMTIEENPRLYLQWAQHENFNIDISLQKIINIHSIDKYEQKLQDMITIIIKTSQKLDTILSGWRKLRPAQQASVLRICIDWNMPVISTNKIFNLFRLSKFKEARSYLLMTKWAMDKGKIAVDLVNQLANKIWIINIHKQTKKILVQGELI